MPKQTNKRRPTRPRQQRRHNTNTGAPSNGNQPVVEPATMNYADLSTEVLHLLLAQRNLSLSGSRATILRRLTEHDRAENSALPRPLKRHQQARHQQTRHQPRNFQPSLSVRWHLISLRCFATS